MTPRLDDAVELLDRALAYTGGVLAEVTDADLTRPTPCARWSLAALLAHMDDALDAFLEASGGVVSVTRPTPGPVPDPTPDPVPDPVGGLRAKACALLGAWVGPRPPAVRLGEVALGSAVLVATAALEITVHGWDVAQATGRAHPVPATLAGGLLDVAGLVVGPGDRGVRFAPARPVPDDAAPDERLLAYLGRT